MALQLGEVVEQRRRQLRASRASTDSIAPGRRAPARRSPPPPRRPAAGACACPDRASLSPASRPKPGALVGDRRRFRGRAARTWRRPRGSPRARRRGSRARARRASRASASARGRPRGSRRASRLYARERFMPTSQSARLRPRAASARPSKSAPSRRLRQAVADGVAGERRDPQPAHRLRAAGGLVDVAEDQLALAPGVGRADDLRDRASTRSRRTTSNWSPRLAHDDQRLAVGSIGRVARRQRFHAGLISCGWASATRCPIAHVTT